MIEGVTRLLAEPVPLGTLLSVLSGLAAAMWTWHTNRLLERKRYTFNVLMQYAGSADILRALDDVNRWIGEGGGSGPVASSERERCMALLLPYFQSIALAANQGMLDRSVLLRARYGTMKTVWEHFRPDVEAKRRALDRPLLYCDLESYLAANEKRYNDYQRRQMQARIAGSPARTGA